MPLAVSKEIDKFCNARQLAFRVWRHDAAALAPLNVQNYDCFVLVKCQAEDERKARLGHGNGSQSHCHSCQLLAIGEPEFEPEHKHKKCAIGLGYSLVVNGLRMELHLVGPTWSVRLVTKLVGLSLLHSKGMVVLRAGFVWESHGHKLRPSRNIEVHVGLDGETAVTCPYN